MALKPLSADMDNIQKLVIPGLDTDMDVIQKLDDEPNDVGGLSPAQLKAEFDKAGNIIKKYLNESLLPSLSGTVAEEEVRTEQEGQRQEAETGRADAEAERVKAENLRAETEAGRADAEDERVKAENLRAAAEELRAQAEALRAQAERERQRAEEARADEHTGLVAMATEQANKAKFEADRAQQIAGGEVVTHVEMEAEVAKAVDKAVDAAVDQAARERLEPLIGNISRYGELTIPAAGWVQDVEKGYTLEVAAPQVTEKHIPLMALDRESRETAGKCKLDTGAETLEGKVRFWAKKVPEKAMTGTLVLLLQGELGSGVALWPASGDKLGGVKVGEGLLVAEDGTLSVDKETVMTGEDLADEEEVRETVSEILNGEDEG